MLGGGFEESILMGAGFLFLKIHLEVKWTDGGWEETTGRCSGRRGER